MKAIRILTVLLALSLLCAVSVLAEPVENTPVPETPQPKTVVVDDNPSAYSGGNEEWFTHQDLPAGGPQRTLPVVVTPQPTPDPKAIISDWRIGNLSYITEAVSGRFTLKGSFSKTYSLRLMENGSMSSDLAMDSLHDAGELRFAIPAFEFTRYTAYTWQDGILTLLPDGPQLTCEYDPASDSFAVLYHGEVTVDDSKPAQAGQSGLPGGECAVSVTFTLTHNRPGDQDGAT